MKNFPFEHEGRTLWYSRSVACSLYLYVYDKSLKEWFVLVSKRGPGCPSNIGKWNVPGGYLDFDERLEDAARRECWEETGIRYNDNVHLASVSTNIHSTKQNVVCSFYGILKVKDIREVMGKLNMDNCEKDEVDEVGFWRVKDILARPHLYAGCTAFGHDEMIVEIYKKRIKCGWLKRWIISLGERLSKIDIKIS